MWTQTNRTAGFWSGTVTPGVGATGGVILPHRGERSAGSADPQQTGGERAGRRTGGPRRAATAPPVRPAAGAGS
ncbi:hypothetical protein NS263_09505 [Curtobacterium oceanosedimentum]|uniref:Uncharacterized protein n=1 Tax=Curtobacterium oceanosedimentum TaxID=465820 RepID=A0ABR5S6U2_9MICO|nr:hypothetical protein NS263_09505 [Curtobacterium oceanosedimentum]